MNSKQNRVMKRRQLRFIKNFANVLEGQIKEWKESPTSTKEIILKELGKVVIGSKSL